MDPNEALRRIRQITADETPTIEELVELHELVAALDDWLSSGGFPPKEWGPKPFKRPEGIPPRRDWGRDHDPDAPVPGKDIP